MGFELFFKANSSNEFSRVNLYELSWRTFRKVFLCINTHAEMPLVQVCMASWCCIISLPGHRVQPPYLQQVAIFPSREAKMQLISPTTQRPYQPQFPFCIPFCYFQNYLSSLFSRSTVFRKTKAKKIGVFPVYTNLPWIKEAPKIDFAYNRVGVNIKRRE